MEKHSFPLDEKSAIKVILALIFIWTFSFIAFKFFELAYPNPKHSVDSIECNCDCSHPFIEEF